jgi:inner membrane protein
MDSLTQLALGAAVGVAVLGRRTAVWKAALWGGIAGTLPDLDVVRNHGDAVRNMTFHRTETHALFYLTLASPLLAWIAARLHREVPLWRRWWLAIWLALVTHPLLDTMTVYGTQLLLPFTDHPFGVGSIFIIDPLYTVPLLVGLAVALSRGDHRGLRWNRGALVLSTAYLAWSAAAQWHVHRLAAEALAQDGGPATRVLVTPTPFNTVVWRVVAMREGGGYQEGFYSLLDGSRPMRFDRFASDDALFRALQSQWEVRRIAWFSHGFFKVHERDGQAVISDLRMGQEPNYSFSFPVARRENGHWVPLVPRNEGARGDVRALLAWLGQRMLGRDLAPPR